MRLRQLAIGIGLCEPLLGGLKVRALGIYGYVRFALFSIFCCSFGRALVGEGRRVQCSWMCFIQVICQRLCLVILTLYWILSSYFSDLLAGIAKLPHIAQLLVWETADQADRAVGLWVSGADIFECDF